MARTLPLASPATMASPTRMVPRLTSMVATTPRPGSTRDSMMNPLAGASGFALRSPTSATSRSVSRKLSSPMRCLALASTKTLSPPHSSGTMPCSASCCLMRSMLASGLSILLMTITTGTPAALAWSMASTVCGMTPSSAATTMAAMSVTLAPRARMAVNAAWPGRVDERDGLAVVLHLVGADVLRDAAGLAGCDRGVADGVEQAGLAVVDVTHDGDDRSPRLEILGIVHGLLLELGLFVGRVGDLHLAAEVGGEDLDGLVAQRLRDGDHLAVAHESLDDVRGHDPEQLGDVLDRRARGDLDQAGRHDRSGLLLLAVATTTAAAATAPVARAAATPGGAGVDDDAALLAGRPAAGTPAYRSARRRRVGLLDRFVVDVDLAVDHLDARLLEVGEHIVDAGLSLSRDVRHFTFRHSPHRLSSFPGRAKTARTAGSRVTGPRKARANARFFSAASRQFSSGHR